MSVFVAKEETELANQSVATFDEDYRDTCDTRVFNDLPYHKRMFLFEVRYKF
ncbi:MAG: hypothetical protein GY749_02800 [Desulfobacteraceae bacterium]|nr:hypothetical protein [Desulfobacteraceae bacterium]